MFRRRRAKSRLSKPLCISEPWGWAVFGASTNRRNPRRNTWCFLSALVVFYGDETRTQDSGRTPRPNLHDPSNLEPSMQHSPPPPPIFSLTDASIDHNPSSATLYVKTIDSCLGSAEPKRDDSTLPPPGPVRRIYHGERARGPVGTVARLAELA